MLGFGIGADYLQSERTDTIAVAKSCAEARTSGAVNLPSICGAPKEEMGGEDQAEESIEQEIAEAIEGLSASLVACQTLIAETPGADPGACDQVRNAISSLVSS